MEKNQEQKPPLQKPSPESKVEIPKEIPIDITPELYQKTKENILKQQHPAVRPYLLQFISWLKDLNALDVYDAIEGGETVKDKYQQMKLNPIRIAVAATRGFLKGSKSLRAKADKALSLEIARLVLRFENAPVYEVLKQFDPKEEYLRRNIQAVKEIFGLVPKQ